VSGADLDAIIVGGGHNGLVCAGYLAKAGLKVLVLERRDVLGGACVTEELFPGYRFSTCSYYCYVLQRKVIDDLALRRHGFHVYQVNPLSYLYPDRRALLTWDEMERTQEAIARFSEHDAKAYPQWTTYWKRAAGLVHPYWLTLPPTLEELRTKVRGTADEGLLEELLTTSMKALVTKFFESEGIRGAFIQAQDVGDPAAQGSAWCYTHNACRQLSVRQDVGIVRGGMGGITTAMAAAARSYGATIRTGMVVERVLVREGRAVGVRLTDGTEMRSQIVVSNADVKRTFLHLVGPEHLPADFFRRVEGLKANAAYLKFHAALSRLPDFSRHFDGDYDARFLAATKICPSVKYFEQSWDDAVHGRPSRNPVMSVQIPSAYDPTMAPRGRHVISVWTLYAPVHLAEGTWDERREEVGEQLMAVLAQYAPDIRDCIENWVLFTPADMERRVGLTNGNIRHIDIIPSQYLAQRPMTGWAHYRTPIEGLYLCGSATHPGGDVTGAPGHNAAHAILAYLSAQRS
jgi:phytoene dehydrogenase-like protein